MRYHIQTTPIWDAFRDACGCPLCRIEADVSARLVSLYLGEAVMEPEFRIRVNKTGFCSPHLRDLYAGDNKLGLALQLHTRTAHIAGELYAPKDKKGAEKLAKKIIESNSTCVICDELKVMMNRYAYTSAQMYFAEAEFPAVLKECGGFCIPHYALLLQNAHKAGAKTAQFLAALDAVQQNSILKTNRDTDRFILMFDYNSKEKQFPGSETVIIKAINKLKGKI